MDNNASPFAGTITAPPDKPRPPEASDKQKAFLMKLASERPTWRAEEDITDERIKEMSKKDASRFIDIALSHSKEVNVAKLGEPVRQTLTDGIYMTADRNFYKVYLTRTSRQQVVGKLHITTDEFNALLTADWEYLGKAGLRLLKPEDKCSQEEAAAFGAMYGICCNCLALLNDPISIHCGYGPVCADNNGWWRPTAREYARILEAQGAKV